MRAAILLLASALCGAPLALADSSDFPQTQRGSSGGGSSGSFSSFNSWKSEPSETQPRPPRAGTEQSAAPSQAERAQQRVPMGGGKPDDGGRGVRDRDEGQGDETDSSGGGPSDPVDLETARQNFATLVEGYVAKRSGKGYWSYAAKKGRAPRKLVDPEVDEQSVRLVRNLRYAASATLRDADGGKPVVLEFEADFAGTHWRIVGVRPPRGRQ
jgi:hypothetical protein